MIPKIIHYCWFGGGKKPMQAEKCIRSWKKHLPDYRIVEWNEQNYDISAAPLFVRQAWEAGMWAFVTDYVRYQVVYESGGFYFDTDVEVLKNLDFLRADKVFFGMQYNNLVASGLGFGAEKGTPILKELMETYEGIPFLLPDGRPDKKPCPRRDAPVFAGHGYRQDGKEQIIAGDVHIYPAEFFCPYGLYDRKPGKTRNTATIHHFSGSWLPYKRRLLNTSRKILGKKAYARIRRSLKGKRRTTGGKPCR